MVVHRDLWAAEQRFCLINIHVYESLPSMDTFGVFLFSFAPFLLFLTDCEMCK